MITLRILTPSSGETHDATAVFLPGAMGSFEVLPGHAALISALAAGELRWRESGSDEQALAIKSGMVRVENDVVTVCCEI
ncbi:MAG: F0F1 ATP synthase subunit epsilon [Bacteroidales bacterium]|nr:F0F1 ATP synthase subunit epsilon [Bacteroidales bacterium]